MSTAGLGLLARAATNLELRRLTGLGAGRRAIDLQKTITVDAPLEEVFVDPKRSLDEDLARMKTLLETSRPASDAAQPQVH